MPSRLVGGRQFFRDDEYEAARRDWDKITKIEQETDLTDPEQVMALYRQLQTGEIEFESVIGNDFDDKIFELTAQLREEARAGRATSREGGSASDGKKAGAKKGEKKSRSGGKTTKSGGKTTKSGKTNSSATPKVSESVEKQAQQLLKRKAIRRNLIYVVFLLIAVGCLGYFFLYGRDAVQVDKQYSELSKLKGTPPVAEDIEVEIHYTDESVVVPEILDEYKNLYLKNKSIIGWLKIDDTNIDYPVMQTVNNEYYLTHSFDGTEDRNGCLFLDCNNDVIRGNTNLIIYGHHMKSGKMFGNLNKYSSLEYYEKHPTISFDTIYEKGTYQIMYVFRDKIQSEESVSFKYYQFIDAVSQEEFNSNMQEMGMMSLYSTGVTASYGDRLLTLSTCDSSEKGGRFVVVAKRIN